MGDRNRLRDYIKEHSTLKEEIKDGTDSHEATLETDAVDVDVDSKKERMSGKSFQEWHTKEHPSRPGKFVSAIEVRGQFTNCDFPRLWKSYL